MRTITVKVTCNIWGNYRGFITGSQSKELGCDNYRAIEWASETLQANPGAVLSDKSVVKMAEVEDYWKRLNSMVRRPV